MPSEPATENWAGELVDVGEPTRHKVCYPLPEPLQQLHVDGLSACLSEVNVKDYL
jgi:hypothetical protein